MGYDLRKITGVMACDSGHHIANQGVLPWSCPEEVAFYRGLIKSQIVVMGYETYKQMPSSFIEEHHVVVFSKKHQSDVALPAICVGSLEEFKMLKNLPVNRKYFMIGGAKIAKLFLENNLIDDFYLSEIHGNYPGDVFFPINLLDKFKSSIFLSNPSFTVNYYEKA